jgi:hypothetical protein
MDKKIIKKGNPRKLAETYYNYGIFKIFEAVVLNYPENPSEIDLDPIFNNIECHFKFIIDSIALNQKNNLLKK